MNWNTGATDGAGEGGGEGVGEKWGEREGGRREREKGEREGRILASQPQSAGLKLNPASPNLNCITQKMSKLSFIISDPLSRSHILSLSLGQVTC